MPTPCARSPYAFAFRVLAPIRPSVPIIERSFTGLLARAGSGLSEGRCLVADR
jgi:hypothetical protein